MPPDTSTCNGSGWLHLGVGKESYAQRCVGCTECLPGTFTNEVTTGFQCTECGGWFPERTHTCLARYRKLFGEDPPVPRGI